MRILAAVILLSSLFVQCKKSDSSGPKGTLCLVNQTANDFSGYNYLEIHPCRGSIIQTTDLLRQDQKCVEIETGTSGDCASWTAVVESNEQIILAQWSGNISLLTPNQTLTVQIGSQNKYSDYRTKLVGNYPLNCHCADFNATTKDTISRFNDTVVCSTDSVPNVYYMRVKATGYLDTLVKYKSDVFAFDAPGGSVWFAPSDSSLHFDITTLKSPGVLRRCTASGRLKH